ncbi:MAG: DUF2799 domain-containing protein [Acinetobacter sp.]|jgi:hypothetical protein|uniref:DUF2799 domain-containing protein n=1 Tax=Acinetobacter sp. TaxID=472 RepID=UPI000FACA052|nr:DUF2799 domain-containing protein [Acinetobacter sp.]MBP9787330.1 DUF2799 domain-containing protein [Acinetobacter sp.]RUP42302.1 MAG: DUF2799 domain-containing protein [Acinetobacter sp.]
MKAILLLSTLSAVLSGCAAMNVEQCKTANWLNVGEKDGAAGHESRLDKYYASCQKANVVPNQSLYEKGYQQGLGYYCRPENIFNEALEGRGDFRVCPLDKRESLRSYYQVANNYYQANSEFNRSQSDINYYLKELERKDLAVKDRDDYKKRLYDLRINSSRVQSRYQDAVRNLERFKAERGLN